MSAYVLRPYQQAAVDATWEAIRAGIPAPLACLPTGAGKTAVVAELARQAAHEWNRCVLVLVHVRELISQLADGIRRHWPSVLCPLGVLSAGLGSREINQITVAGIQSSYRRACDLGPRDLIIVDEAHLIPSDGMGMYRTLLDDLRTINPGLRLVGLTATPYRLGSGIIFGGDSVFSDMVYDAGVKPLIEQGFLSPLRGKDGGAPDLSGVHRRGGEFIAGELEAAMTDEEKVKHAVAELCKHGADRRAWLVFCCGCKHAAMVSAALCAAGIEAPVVTGETPTAERDDITKRYRAGGLRCLVNVNVLTTGFDAPHVDLVALLRPTESPGLYYQMVGRGLRRCDGKTDCLVLDLAGNIARHGPIDQLNDRLIMAMRAKANGEKELASPPMKTCPECEESLLAALRICPACGYEFQKNDARHDTEATELSPISAPAVPVWSEVSGIEYKEWTKKGATDDAPKTLRVDYFDGIGRRIASEWVCVEHALGSYASNRAMEWLGERLTDGMRLDFTQGEPRIDGPHGSFVLTAEALAAVAHKALRCPTAIETVEDGRFEKVTRGRFDEIKEESSSMAMATTTDERAGDVYDPPF